MLPLRVLDGARIELRQAAAWYRLESRQLAVEFSAELKRCLEHARTYPSSGPVIAEGHGYQSRRFLLARFPYAVVAVHADSELVFVALSHTSRRPGYWLRRLASVRP